MYAQLLKWQVDDKTIKFYTAYKVLKECAQYTPLILDNSPT